MGSSPQNDQDCTSWPCQPGRWKPSRICVNLEKCKKWCFFRLSLVVYTDFMCVNMWERQREGRNNCAPHAFNPALTVHVNLLGHINYAKWGNYWLDFSTSALLVLNAKIHLFWVCFNNICVWELVGGGASLCFRSGWPQSPSVSIRVKLISRGSNLTLRDACPLPDGRLEGKIDSSSSLLHHTCLGSSLTLFLKPKVPVPVPARLSTVAPVCFPSFLFFFFF